MKRIIAKRTLRAFWENHADSEQYLKTWYETVKNSTWNSPNDIKKTYINASILKGNRVVFNIKGNSYRLIAKFNFEKQWVFIRFIGTHTEYNKIDRQTFCEILDFFFKRSHLALLLFYLLFLKYELRLK